MGGTEYIDVVVGGDQSRLQWAYRGHHDAHQGTGSADRTGMPQVLLVQRADVCGVWRYIHLRADSGTRGN